MGSPMLGKKLLDQFRGIIFSPGFKNLSFGAWSR